MDDDFRATERVIVSADRRQEWWAGVGATTVVCGGAFFGWLVLSQPQNAGTLADTVVPAADAATLFTQLQTGAGPLIPTHIVLAAADMTATTPLANGDIMKVQAKLKSLGFDPGTPDGKAGPHTLKALNAYRKSLGLQPATVVDRQAVAPLTP